MEKIHVLLVEDEQTLAMIIKDTLEEQDFIITTAGDGEEGLRKFFEQKPDVLVADVMIQSLGKDGTKSVSFTVAKPDMLRTIDVLNDNKDSLGIKKLDYDENVAKISVIGAGVRSHSGVAAKMFGALANAGINTEMITTSEIRITALIDEAYADQAMRAIHETFLERV